MTTKSRTTVSGAVSGRTRTSQFVSFTNYTTAGRPNTETVIDGGGHHRYPNGRWSGGGPFSLTRDKITYVTPFVRRTDGVGNLLTEGTIRIQGVQGGFSYLSGYSHPSPADLLADGTTAIARTEPTNPSVDLATAIGELRSDGLPSLPGLTTALEKKTRLARSSGGEYLNVQFGWVPLMSDLRKFASTVQDSDDILRKYQEIANRPVHRRYVWPDQQTTKFTPFKSFTLSPAIGFAQGSITETVSQKKWFSAEYEFFLPVGSSTSDKIRRAGAYARKLYGIDLSPEVIWNLSPWSWAADWFANTGDILHNVSAFSRNGLVLRYGYIMCHTQIKREHYGTYTDDGITGKTYPISAVQVIDTMTRIQATPFGFGVNFDGLNAYQLAIVGALGLSRWA